ncbi:hypothetical protein [Devosia sp. FJ2-5-3]|uniref:hypothetical protein n=1 Tax=Devosia sp. FJ2-5-3 TaxID=2976680 RepID=UPI0023D81AE6|nr:hypothetical protein [Devosia sp. FJ2-5-3]WEJ57478.1 phospholipase D family protein [Devosia sp. FJ2-5-3]
MTPDQIARRYEELSGFELLDYAEAAVPLWQLNVEAVSVVRKGLQPIREFVLRSLVEGLSADDLVGFLGLEDSIVRGALADLASDKFIAYGDEVAITDLGRKALAEGVSTPAEEVLTILFDGITRKPVGSLGLDLAFTKEVEDGALAEIPATPPTQPTINDLSLPEIDQVLSDQPGRQDASRDLLRVKRIARYRRVFRRVVALVFRSRKGEIRTRFIVNGVPDENLEQRFAEHSGNIRKGLVKAFSDGYIKSNVRAHLGQDVARMVLDQEDYLVRQRAVSLAALKVAAVQRRIDAVDRGENSEDQRPAPSEIEAALAAETEARRSLTQSPARPAAVYEVSEFLRRALSEARSSISISTRGLAPHIVDRDFIGALEQLLKRGVQVNILLNEEANQWRSRGKDWAQAFDGLAKLSTRFPAALQVRDTKERRYYHLSWDNRVALVANRPMLSNHGRIRSFEQFAGFVMNEPESVAAYLTRVAR